ncbi:DNA recombination protein RmuC, partial [bacterium]|nr:DNA recombination protein RmuC [bacterium]
GFGGLILAFMAGFWMLLRSQDQRWREFDNKIASNNQTIELMTQWLHEMRGSVERQTSMFYRQFETSNQVINSRLDNATRLMSSVSTELGQIQEIGRQIQRFQDILQSPKLRGNLGEQILKDLLEQVLPPAQFKWQHRFKKGTQVDALIITDKGSIPVDSKFPLESFRRFRNAKTDPDRKKWGGQFVTDVKKHVDSVSTKYILPEEGTVDFALIYIPNEVVYYEILQTGEVLSTYANQKNVLFVSPNNFYYFLKVVLVALEGKRLEAAGQHILKFFKTLQQDGRRLSDQLRVLTTHMNNAKNSLDRVNNEVVELVNRIEEAKYMDFQPAATDEAPKPPDPTATPSG